jgi:hypothetical protein
VSTFKHVLQNIEKDIKFQETRDLELLKLARLVEYDNFTTLVNRYDIAASFLPIERHHLDVSISTEMLETFQKISDLFVALRASTVITSPNIWPTLQYSPFDMPDNRTLFFEIEGRLKEILEAQYD